MENYLIHLERRILVVKKIMFQNFCTKPKYKTSKKYVRTNNYYIYSIQDLLKTFLFKAKTLEKIHFKVAIEVI